MIKTKKTNKNDFTYFENKNVLYHDTFKIINSFFINMRILQNLENKLINQYTCILWTKKKKINYLFKQIWFNFCSKTIPEIEITNYIKNIYTIPER